MDAPAPAALFDPLEEGFVEWPYDQYRRLRADDPVHRSELLHGWVMTRYHDVNRILRDQGVSAEIDKAAPTPLTEAEIERRDNGGDGHRGGDGHEGDPEHGRDRTAP